MFLEWGANLESRAAHTHPKNTQVPPTPGVSPPSWLDLEAEAQGVHLKIVPLS